MDKNKRTLRGSTDDDETTQTLSLPEPESVHADAQAETEILDPEKEALRAEVARLKAQNDLLLEEVEEAKYKTREFPNIENLSDEKEDIIKVIADVAHDEGDPEVRFIAVVLEMHVEDVKLLLTELRESEYIAQHTSLPGAEPTNALTDKGRRYLKQKGLLRHKSA